MTEVKPYWDVRLQKEYDIVRFRNGYTKNAPSFDIEFKSIIKGYGNEDWGGDETVVYILK